MFAPLVEAPPHCVGTTAELSARVKVVSINLRHDSDEWKRRFELVADELARLDPDVVGMQEVELDKQQGETLNALLARRGHAPYVLLTQIKSGKGANGGEGIGILSRWPIVKHASADLGDERVALLARVQHPSGGSFDIVTTHLDAHRGDEGEMLRDREALKLLEFLDQNDECRPTILTGDMNSTEERHAVTRFRAAHFNDSFRIANPNDPGHTAMIKLENGAFVPHPRRRIDFILARSAGDRAVSPITSAVVFENHDAKGFHPSDHFGVTTTFDMRM